jgi:hypothetical protein
MRKYTLPSDKQFLQRGLCSTVEGCHCPSTVLQRIGFRLHHRAKPPTSALCVFFFFYFISRSVCGVWTDGAFSSFREMGVKLLAPSSRPHPRGYSAARGWEPKTSYLDADTASLC